jgi:hypothetical protein
VAVKRRTGESDGKLQAAETIAIASIGANKPLQPAGRMGRIIADGGWLICCYSVIVTMLIGMTHGGGQLPVAS